MERDFEKEFIELKQSEVPDLWGRIEAGLTPKNVESTEMKAEQTVASKPAVSFEHKKIGQNAMPNTVQDAAYMEQNPRRKMRIYRWGLLAAAGLCLLIILPVLSLTRSNSSSSDMSGAGEFVAEDMEAAVSDEGFDIAAGAASEPSKNGGSEIQSAENGESEIQSAESIMNGYTDASAGADAESDGADAMEDGASNSMVNVVEASRGEAASAADSMLDDSDVQKDEMKELQGAKAEDWNDILQEGQQLHEVKIEVSEMIQSDSVNQTYTVRAIVVSPDEDGYLYEGAELTLLYNEETTYDLVTKPRREIPLRIGETYIVDLQYEGSGDFIIVKIN